MDEIKGDEVEYVIVSKWQEKKDFQTWVARPEHVEEHKEMNKKLKAAKVNQVHSKSIKTIFCRRILNL